MTDITGETVVVRRGTGSAGPLAGIRVLELAGIGPGPFACLLLAELGAEVVRVDRPGGAGLAALPSVELYRSRPSLVLDLKSEKGREVLLRMVERADVLVEGNRPGVTERLGVGPTVCLARNPRLIYARMTGWGQDGPLAQRAGHDITYAALTGALHAVGPREKPMQALNLIADFGGGALYLVVGVLAALLERQHSQQGQVIDAAMVDGAASLMTMIYGIFGAGGWRDQRQANLLDGGAPFYDTYECADGKHVAVGALEPQFYAALLDGLGLTGKLHGDQYDQSYWPQHRQQFAAAFRTRTRDEWATLFQDTDACVAPVLSLAEAPHHPHLAARNTFINLDGIIQPRVAPRFSRTPGLDPTPPRPTDADTTTVLTNWGLHPDEITDLLTNQTTQQNNSPQST